MLWNWYTIDACFLSSTWQVRSNGAFAGSCIGVIFLVISLEFLRRAQRDFDRYLVRSKSPSIGSRGDSSSGTSNDFNHTGLGKDATIVRARASRVDYRAQLRLWQHLIRSFLYMMQFAVGYFIMLLAMYFNGAFFESGCHHHSRCRLSVEPPYRVVSC